MWVVLFGSTQMIPNVSVGFGRYTLGPCLGKCLRMHTWNGKVPVFQRICLRDAQGSLLDGHVYILYLANGCKWWKSAYPTLPTQQKFTLLPRVFAHAYADCKISGQQPSQLHKEFSRTHEVGHSKKNDAAHFDSGSEFIKWSAAQNKTIAFLCISHNHFRKCLPFRHSVFLVETKNWKRLMWSPW